MGNEAHSRGQVSIMMGGHGSIHLGAGMVQRNLLPSKTVHDHMYNVGAVGQFSTLFVCSQTAVIL